MNSDPTRFAPAAPSRIRRLRRPVIALAVCFVLASCTTIVLRQGWNQQLGPVLPHDSFPADCSLCHRGDTWHDILDEFSFDHEAETKVALVGAHADAQCLLCHNDRGHVADFAARGCAGCHVDTHRGNLGNQCADCHNEASWRPNDMISRHNRTRFPLIGAHASTACWACHPGAQVGNFAGADPACVSCHASDVARSVDHIAQGWVTDCDRCHRPVDWTPAAFRDHPSSFALTAGHGGLACASCHAPNTFQGLSTDCVSCHLADYNATTDPNHAANGFSTTCNDCHSTTTWGGSLNHRFPLQGPHNLNCSDCHTAPGNFMVFNCTDCHEHRQSRMDDKHDDVNGYVWVSSACYACHPDGRE